MRCKFLVDHRLLTYLCASYDLDISKIVKLCRNFHFVFSNKGEVNYLFMEYWKMIKEYISALLIFRRQFIGLEYEVWRSDGEGE